MGFKVPDDLVKHDLTIGEVLQILSVRKQKRHAQTRLDNLPLRAEELKDDIAGFEQKEADLLQRALGAGHRNSPVRAPADVEPLRVRTDGS